MSGFDDLGLDPKVLRAVKDAGYENPTPIQAEAIPAALQGRDVLGIAQTGTGKTASFTLPMITLLAKGRARARMPRSLVLCPTRELAAQVAENFDIYAKHVKLTKALLIGGVSFKEQEALIDRGVDVLIATPGRLLDHFERGKLLLTGVQIMVVDEADRMLDMGFIPDIERIFKLTPFTRQTLFFSATMAPEIERITNMFLQAPVKVEVARQATASETIEQEAIHFRPSRRDRAAKEKRQLLRAALQREGESCKNAIVFCNRKVDVDIVAKSLRKHGFDAAPIHGDLDQSQRMRTLEAFRDGELRILVASDVAARGLDIPDVSHVINFDVPTHPEDYVHRIGRTGRAGRSGKAITLVAPADEKYLEAIEKLIAKPIPKGENPLGTPSGPEAAPQAEKAESACGEKPRKRRSRGGRGRKREESAPADAAAPDKATADASAGDTAETSPEQQADTGAEARTGKAEPQVAADKPARKSRTRKDAANGRDEAVVGMGDHMPSFIAMSFEERRAG
jgi:ATP-dependent RNA helicase RhlE